VVDLLIAYSKQVDRVSELVSAAERLRVGDAGEPVRVSVCSMEGSLVQQRVMDRLGEAELRRLVSEFREGVTKRELAERYAMSESTVKRILRKRGARRTPAA
jgi:DNA invertase Pin-like site-specific DNA recombinase